MVVAFVLVAAGLLQLVAIAVVVNEAVTLNETSTLGIAVALYVSSVLLVIPTTEQLFNLLLRLFMTKFRDRTLEEFRHWGIRRELLGDSHILMLLFLGLWFGYSAYLAAVAAVPVLGLVWPRYSEQTELVALWIVAFLAVVQWRTLSCLALAERKRTLDALPAAFHGLFPVSEIISMRECLRVAPENFWEEYISLPDRQVSEATNRKFRDRAASYEAASSRSTQRISLLVAVLSAIVAATALFWVLLGPELLQWFQTSADRLLMPRMTD